MENISFTVLLILIVLSICGINNYNYANDQIIDGYMDKISYFPGDTATVFMKFKNNISESATLKLYSINNILVDKVDILLTAQRIKNIKPWENGYGYTPSFKYVIPKKKSGLYLWEKRIPFIIKDKSKMAEIVVVYPSNTEHAYTNSGGKSLYTYNSSDKKKSAVVSFLRPLRAPVVFACGSFLEWLNTQDNLNINLICDMDLDDFDIVKNAKLLIIIGHSEYWTRAARKNFDKFVDKGGDALILSGNTMWWQVRYSKDGTQLICYKNAVLDPCPDPLYKTIKWNDPKLSYPIIPSIGADFDNGGFGIKEDKGWDGYKVVLSSSPLLEKLKLKRGDIIKIPTREYDGTLLTGFDTNGYPIVDSLRLGFHKVELIGFDLCSIKNKETVGTFIVFQKTKESGIIINTGSTDWCTKAGIGGVDGHKIKIITTNMINKLIKGNPIF